MDFNQLLRESRRLESQMEGVSSAMRGVQQQHSQLGDAAAGVPLHALRSAPLTRSLAQLDVASSKLVRAQGVVATPAADSQAQLLLAAKGIDVRKQGRALKELQQAQPRQTRGAPAAGAAGPMPIDTFHPLDIEGFLQQQQQLLCHSAMEEAARVTASTYRRHDLSSLDEDWERTKRDIMDGMGFRAGKSAIAQAASEAAMQQAQAQEEAGKRRAGAMGHTQQYATAAAAAAGPVLGMEQAIYARSVQELNRARVRRTPVPLLGMMRGAAAAVDEFFQRQNGAGGADHQNVSANGLSVGDVTDCWDVLRSMLQAGSDEIDGDGTPLVEKAFAAAYEAPSTSPEGLRFRAQLIQGAKAYSEHLFAAYIKRVVAAHPEARRTGAQQGARAPFARQVSAYVAVLAERLPAACRDLQLEGLPLWPQVYYCFRCGHIDAALQLLQQALEQSGGGLGGSRAGTGLGGAGSHHEQLSRTFVECMDKRSQSEGALPATLWQALHDEFQRELATAVNTARARGASSSQAGMLLDPFKLALYHLLGRFRLPAHLIDLSQLVAPTTEDYLWLKLSVLIETAPGGAAADALVVPAALRDHVDATSLRLASLQQDLLSRGEAAFNPDGRHPLAYFKVLLLSLQFEQAVYYLIKTAHFTVGVHFAIALEYAGCMHVHTNSKAELLIAVAAAGAGAAGSGVPASFALNYSRVLRKYVESFVRSHPFEAFHYLYLLHPLSGTSARGGRSVRGLGSSNASFGLLASASDNGVDDVGGDADASSMSSDPSFPALRDLLLETREFDLLAGSIVPTGSQGDVMARAANTADSIQTSRALLYNYFSASEAASLLVSTAGALAAHGVVLDAIQLYLLAYRFDLAAELSLKALAPLVSSPLQSEERQAMVGVAQRVQRVVATQQESGQLDRSRGSAAHVGDAPASSLQALHKLLSLVNYFDHYHLGPQNYDTALQVLSQESLLPMQSADVHAYAAAFLNPQQTHPAVCRTIANLAVSLMDIYYVQFQITKRDVHAPSLYQPQHAQREQLKQQRLAALRAQAHALIGFMAAIQKSKLVDEDVHRKIMAVEALMTT